MSRIETYYKEIINIIIDSFHEEFINADKGHCMKITGLGSGELEYLWDTLRVKYPNLDTFIISDKGSSAESRYITATKLIEYRNKQVAPLLILVPSNSRTAAEDSYGNATFKEISLEGIESKLKKRLLANIPDEYQLVIKTNILAFLKNENIKTGDIINYLITLHEEGFNDENIGNHLYYLNLLPDANLLMEEVKIRHRLTHNIQSIGILSSFNIPVYDRIRELPLEPNTLQKDIAGFFRLESQAKTAMQIGYLIFKKYPSLNFSNWKIPDLDFTHIKLFSEDINSLDFKVEDGIKVLYADNNKNPKVKLKFTTRPNPNEINDLKFFSIILMAVDGGAGEEIMLLRKLKNSTIRSSDRTATVELNSNIIEEGAYFFKVMAEDDQGNILNDDDDFKDPVVQKEWENEKNDNPDIKKSSFDYKLTCDTEDFNYILDNNPDPPEEQKKDKLKNVLQAYFKYRIDQFKSDEEAHQPEPHANSNVWLNDNKKKHTSVFHIRYSDSHNYQINISTKLRLIEYEFLKNMDSFGLVRATLNNNISAYGFDSLRFIPSEITSIVPNAIIKLRKKIFSSILDSNSTNDGVFETANLFDLYPIISEYLDKITRWMDKLKMQISSENLDVDEKRKLQHFLTELQMLDVARIKTKQPNGKSIEALLISPLHPLRLSWFMQLIDVFNNWEQKTRDFPKYKDTWSKNLTELFLNELSPGNNPLVLVEPLTLRNYLYSGELAYGWGLYLNLFEEDIPDERMMSISKQLKHYILSLLNITKDSYIETDVSKKLVVRHLRNYLLQHPYVDKFIINLVNAGDASVFADAFVELESNPSFKDISYEIRIFKGDDKIIEHGEALKNLLNPESNITEAAEAFSQPSKNRLFPKLRFSINKLSDYLKQPTKYTAHISFLSYSFPVNVELIKPHTNNRNFYLNGLISDSTVIVDEDGDNIKWNRFIIGNKLFVNYNGTGSNGIKLFDNIQSFVSSTLASKFTDAVPSTKLILKDIDKVLISNLHDYSDWVITFDKNLGPEIFDQPSKNNESPYLLDYIPGEEVTGISSFLTTRPTSEIYGLLGPHFEEFDIDIQNNEGKRNIKNLLEDLRAISSSLILQLNSTKNKAIEVIGMAFTKRVLEKKGLLSNAFLIPIDLHQNLFDNIATENKSRADILLVSIEPKKKEILISVIEVKCRKSLNEAEKNELKIKIADQISNTIETLRIHFDPEYEHSYDRLDREIKNKELKSIFEFYLARAYRFDFLQNTAFDLYNNFLQNLDNGFKLKFNQLGLIFDFSTPIKHQKEIIDNDLTIYTFGRKLIDQIMDPYSDLNTRRLEDNELDNELVESLGLKEKLKSFIKKFKPETEGELEYDKPEIENEGQNKTDESYEETKDVKIKEEHNRLPEENAICTSLDYDVLIGKSSASDQFGILGESIHGKKIAIDLSETNTMSLFGVQGGGKSYTIGTITEMVLKQFENVNELPSPLAGVIFHYSESMQYEPEFTSMIYPNDEVTELKKLKDKYGANPDKIEDVIILTPKDKMEERQAEYPSIQVLPIAFNSQELNVQDWMFLLGAIGNDSTYIKQLKAIMKEHRKHITLNGITESVESSELLSPSQKALARQKLSFAREYIDDSFFLRDKLKPSRLIIVDLRDEFIVKDEALGLFVIMLNIFSSVKNDNGKHFNKFIVFDEAHKYMNNKDLTGNIVTAIREMRHKGVSIMIASQDPPSLPNEIIELSSIVLMHKFNSPLWLKHVQKSVIQLSTLGASDMAALNPGEGFLWATKASEKSISAKPVKISTRPRVTKHGGGTVKATGI